MAVISYPAALRVKRQDFRQERADLSFFGGDAGSQQSRLLGPPRWACDLIGEEQVPQADAALWRWLLLALRGRVNQLEVYDLLNTLPAGTARGTWSASSTAAVGATSLAISCGVGQAGKTILRGDWIGVNQTLLTRQLLHVQADVTLDGSGNGTLTFEPPLRTSVPNASAVVYDKPTCLMRHADTTSRWTSVRPRQGGFSLSLIESWE